ncbi:DUF2971 domain-containing protein [Clostridium oceanicum]|uniref:DUF2971 domain-containing protein n=1 Tax=Clostridium oceanicum TaxID=1543 RepID=A0ABN1JD45_9CLOT
MCSKDSKEFIERAEEIIDKCIKFLSEKDYLNISNIIDKTDNILILYKLGEILLEEKIDDLYRKCYEKALYIETDNLEEIYFKGLIAYYLKQSNKSKDYFKRILNSNSEEIKDLYYQGMAAVCLNGNDSWLSYYNKILKTKIKKVDDFYYKGIVSCYLKKDDIAIRYFDEFLKNTNNTKDIFNIYNKILNLYYNQMYDFKKSDLIKKFIEKILDIGIDDVNHIKLLYDLGKMYGEFENENQVVYEKFLKRIIEIAPEKEGDYICKGISCLLLITYNEGKGQKKLSINSKKVDYYNKKAQKNYWNLVKKVATGSKELREEIFKYNTFTPFLHEFLDKENTNDELYHYTSIEALKSILEKQELWLTKSEFLNDPTENSYITDIKWDFDSCKLDKKFLNEIKDELKHIYSKKEESIKKDVYILSMTTNKDNLPMWQNYSNSEGYNIKFNKNRLRKRFSSLNRKKYTSFLKSKVRYIDREDEEWINNEHNKKIIYNLIQQIYDSGKNENVDEKLIKTVIVSHLRIMALFIKHPGFQYEDEYRFVFIPNFWGVNYNNMDFRTKKNVLIPFIKIPINESDLNNNKTLVEKITMGPLCDKELCERGIRDFLNLKHIKKHNGDDINIDKSDIPLRSI